VDAIAWWIDSGATTHVCKDRCWFKTYEPVEDGSVLYMGDDHFAPVHGKGSVALEFSSGKTITLFNVLYVPKVRIIHETTTPYTPQQNCVAERKNRAFKEMVNSMLSYLGFSEGFWGEAMLTASYLLNKVPNKRNKTTPYELWYKKRPNLAFLRVWGCRAVVRLPDPKGKTLGEKGFRQKEGIDYFDTYAPVARITTIRLLLDLAAIHNLVIHQMDVKTTFLNGDLDEEVYTKPPKDLLCRFDEVVLSSGFHLNQSDKCVYRKFDDSGKGVIICLCVDDMLIFGTDQNQVDKTKKFLSSRFSMKDMEESDVILGIKIKRENKGIVITQSHYIEKILKKFNREDCSPVSTLIDPVEKLKLNTDIAYVVGRLSRFTNNPSRQYWKAITRVFKYLRGTMNYGLTFVRYPSVLEAYSDVSWINHVEDLSSTSGWVFLLGGGAISWASKKQTCITGSTMEYEFIALCHGVIVSTPQVEWLRNLIHEVQIWPKPIAPISVRCDSAPTMAMAYSQIYNGKSRHLGVRHSMVRELIKNSVISIEFVRTQHNLADHLTKGLARDLLEIGTQVLSSRGARTKRATYVNMKFCRFKKLGLGFLYVH
nr:zinc finger, CCHC-type [Tanacetum cinerariifolium]